MEQLARWVGQRVALRHRVGERDGRPLHSDAVGELAEAGPDAVVVHTRRGPVRVQRAAVVAVRAVPPAVPRRASWGAVAHLEGLCADAWPAAVDVPLGAWRLRAAGGFTGRANSAVAVGDPGMPVAAALAAVRRFAAEHRIAPRVQAPIGSPWDRAVAGEGWVLDTGHAAGAEVAVLVGELAAPAHCSAHPGAHPTGPPDPAATAHCSAHPGAHPDVPPELAVELLDHPDPRWWALSLDRDPTPAERAVLDPAAPPRTAFALVAGTAAARGAVVGDHLHLSRLVTVPERRRAGHAAVVTAALAGWAHGLGARWVVLQVALHNDAGLAFARRLGAREHHRYRYLVPPA